MNTQEKLERIKARCAKDAADYAACENILSDGQRRAMAAIKSTLAAIDGLQRLEQWRFIGWEGDAGIRAEAGALLDDILSAWPDELL